MSESSLSQRKLQQFAYLMSAAIIIIGGMLLPWLWSFAWPLWPWLLGGGLLVCAWLRPLWLSRPYNYWMIIAEALAWLNTRLLLGMVFIGLFTTFGVLLRAFGKDPLAKSFDRQSVTYRVPKAPREPDHLKRPF